MAKNNRYMDGMGLLKKAAGVIPNASRGIQRFGEGLRKSYDDAQKKWQASPRYKKAVQRAKWEGGRGF